MPLFRCAVLWVLLWSLGSSGGAAPSAVPTVVAGSKRFTESHVLGEIVRSTLADARVPAEHKPGLGSRTQLLSTLALSIRPAITP